MNDTRRVLIRIPNWLGDALLARPLLHGLRRALPQAELIGVGPEPLLDLLRADAVLDRLEPWTREPRAARALVATLRHSRPDAALVLPPSFSSALFAWRSGARVRIGYRSEGRGVLLTHAPRRSARGELHLSREYLALGGPLGVEAVPVPTLAPKAAAITAADELMSRFGVSGSRLAVLGPGALFGPAKRWGEDRFASLGGSLARRGYDVMVCGAAGEREACERVARAIGGSAVSLAGATTLDMQAAVCARATLAVCNDSGLAHLSAAVGCATVAIFGSTSSAWTAPLGDRVRVVQHGPVCSPCFQRTCRIGYRCFAAIGVNEVERACEELAA